MNQKKKPAATQKPTERKDKPITSKKDAHDKSDYETKAGDSQKPQAQTRQEPNSPKGKWYCNQCFFDWSGFIINFAIAIAAFAVLYQTSTHFNIGKQPYLQISDIKIDSFQVGKTAVISYKINNLGEHPTKIIGAKSVSAGRNIPMTFAALDSFNNQSQQLINRYITKEAPLEEYFRFGIVTEEMIDLMKNQGYFICNVGFAKYQNLVTKDTGTYKYIFRVYPNTFQFDVNENEDLP